MLARIFKSKTVRSLIESDQKVQDLKFHAMRAVKNKKVRDAITKSVAKGIGKGAKVAGVSAFVEPSHEAQHVANIDRDGYTELDMALSPQKLATILQYADTLKCYDPFHKEYGDFAYSDIPASTHVANFRRDDLVRCPEIMELANDPGILNIVQEFLGARPTISNLNMWWSIGGHAQAEEAQLFHRDVDDFKFIKFFIYLTDVSALDGPHTYVRGSSSATKLLAIRRYQDSEIEAAFGKENVIEFIRPKGSTFMVNTYGFHKGLLPISGNRLLLQVQYSLNPIAVEKYAPTAGLGYAHDAYINRLLLK